MVGGRPPRARADETRPPAPPVPRQVHPPVRRDTARAARPPRRARARPVRGSGTTLVQALESGYDATGVDIAGFNELLVRVKMRPYNLEALRRDLVWAHAAADAFEPLGRYPGEASAYVRAWYAPAAAEELLHFRSLIDQVGSANVLRVVLARSARSARRTARSGTRPLGARYEPDRDRGVRRRCRHRARERARVAP